MQAKRVRSGPPVFPELAKQAGIEGVVSLNVLIDR
jgi:outer membrane biosynthesis protein TonB